MKKLSIAQIEERLEHITTESDPFIAELIKDERKGVIDKLDKWRKERQLEVILQEKFQEMTYYERKYRSEGFKFIAGVDEVGRGPLAGPVVTAAVILPEAFFLPGLDDSKKLSEKKRKEYDAIIRKEALSYSIAMIHADEIDELNIYQATKKAMRTAIATLTYNPDFLLIDAMKLETLYPSESIIKGDAKSITIAAASVVAKVARDEFMKKIALEFPAYGFDKNMGYGTKEHLLAIDEYGITSYHRKSFAPVKEAIETNPTEQLTLDF